MLRTEGSDLHINTKDLADCSASRRLYAQASASSSISASYSLRQSEIPIAAAPTVASYVRPSFCVVSQLEVSLGVPVCPPLNCCTRSEVAETDQLEHPSVRRNTSPAARHLMLASTSSVFSSFPLPLDCGVPSDSTPFCQCTSVRLSATTGK